MDKWLSFIYHSKLSVRVTMTPQRAQSCDSDLINKNGQYEFNV